MMMTTQRTAPAWVRVAPSSWLSDHNGRATTPIRPIRNIDNWSWYLDTNETSRAISADFYVTKQTGYKPIIQKFWGSSYTVKCEGVRTRLLKGGRGAWVSVPQRCLVDKNGDAVRRVRVFTEAVWGSTADRAPGTLKTARYTAWVARG